MNFLNLIYNFRDWRTNNIKCSIDNIESCFEEKFTNNEAEEIPYILFYGITISHLRKSDIYSKIEPIHKILKDKNNNETILPLLLNLAKDSDIDDYYKAIVFNGVKNLINKQKSNDINFTTFFDRDLELQEKFYDGIRKAKFKHNIDNFPKFDYYELYKAYVNKEKTKNNGLPQIITGFLFKIKSENIYSEILEIEKYKTSENDLRQILADIVQNKEVSYYDSKHIDGQEIQGLFYLAFEAISRFDEQEKGLIWNRLKSGKRDKNNFVDLKNFSNSLGNLFELINEKHFDRGDNFENGVSNIKTEISKLKYPNKDKLIKEIDEINNSDEKFIDKFKKILQKIFVSPWTYSLLLQGAQFIITYIET